MGFPGGPSSSSSSSRGWWCQQWRSRREGSWPAAQQACEARQHGPSTFGRGQLAAGLRGHRAERNKGEACSITRATLIRPRLVLHVSIFSGPPQCKEKSTCSRFWHSVPRTMRLHAALCILDRGQCATTVRGHDMTSRGLLTACSVCATPQLTSPGASSCPLGLLTPASLTTTTPIYPWTPFLDQGDQPTPQSIPHTPPPCRHTVDAGACGAVPRHLEASGLGPGLGRMGRWGGVTPRNMGL